MFGSNKLAHWKPEFRNSTPLTWKLQMESELLRHRNMNNLGFRGIPNIGFVEKQTEENN